MYKSTRRERPPAQKEIVTWHHAAQSLVYTIATTVSKNHCSSGKRMNQSLEPRKDSERTVFSPTRID